MSPPLTELKSTEKKKFDKKDFHLLNNFNKSFSLLVDLFSWSKTVVLNLFTSIPHYLVSQLSISRHSIGQNSILTHAVFIP